VNRENRLDGRIEALGTFGVAATSNWLASQVAMRMLEIGGNAFDAATAAGFLLQVVEPHQCGPGGEVVIQILPAGANEPVVVCGQGVAPAGASIAEFSRRGITTIPGQGPLAATVPGCVDAWLLMLRDHGRLRLEEVLAPAIRYASEGFPIYNHFASVVEQSAEKFRRKWPASAAVYLNQGDVPKVGGVFRNPTLAATYSALVSYAKDNSRDRQQQIEFARDYFYRGRVAEEIDEFGRKSGDASKDGSTQALLRGDDLAKWNAAYERPEQATYQGWTVFKPGFWSQGPVFLQCLKLLNESGLAEVDAVGADYVHRLTEAMKLAFADRDAWYGDSQDDQAFRTELLSDGYTASRRRLLCDVASTEFAPGALAGRSPRMPAFESLPADELMASRPGAFLGAGDTSHIDVIDRWGNIVAATPSGGWLDGSPIIPSLGFPLGTRCQMFWLQEGLPSSLRPGRRPRTTLSPTIAISSTGVRLAFGARGSDMQDQWLLQFFTRFVDSKWGLQAAMDGPTFQTSHMPQSHYPRIAAANRLILHSLFDASVRDDLRNRGHRIEPGNDHRWNHSCAAAVSGNLFTAAARSVSEAAAIGR
jgi:gamma-glutamyltranspeptidase/glutathione hydrolase